MRMGMMQKPKVIFKDISPGGGQLYEHPPVFQRSGQTRSRPFLSSSHHFDRCNSYFQGYRTAGMGKVFHDGEEVQWGCRATDSPEWKP